jgi:transposase
MVVNKNSSKLPSSDGFKSPAPKAREKWAAKKSGGQNGHKGHTLEPQG